jgi:hypothetical protein
VICGKKISPHSSEHLETPQPRFLTRRAQLVPLGAAFISAFVYALTLAPTITWAHDGADSADFAAAAYTLGIPHPPGYPLYTLLTALCAHLPFVEPAHGAGFLSVIAAACAIFALTRVGNELLTPLASGWRGALLAAVGALTFAFAPMFWSQANIVEVYALHLFLAAVVLWAMVSTHRARVPLAALAFGVGLAHHLTIVLLAPGALLALRPARRDARDASPVAVPPWGWLPLVVAPLALYAYLPLRAAADPPINWGDPRTLDHLVWMLTAAPYRAYLFGVSIPDALSRIAFSARLLFNQFTVVGVVLGLWGILRLWKANPRLALALALNFALIFAYAIVYDSRDSFVYLLPAFALYALWLMYGAADLLTLVENPNVARALTLALLLLPLWNVLANFAAMDLAADRTAYDFAREVTSSAPREAVLFAEGDEDYLALTYYRYVADETSQQVIVSQGLLQYAWYADEVARKLGDAAIASSANDSRARVVAIINASKQKSRSVCFHKSSPTLPEYSYEVSGELSCVK